MEILKTIGLNKSYGHIRAVNNLDLKVEDGSIFGILGPNGSGKTTTLSIIMGIMSADNGHYLWFEKIPDNKLNQKIGALIESPNFYPYLSCYKNLKIVTEIKHIPENDIERVLKIVNLYDRRQSKFKQLSLGMKQRLALASVLLGDPKVLVLDEPTNGLDPEGIAEVREIIKLEASRNKTVILASHILDEVEKVCSDYGILKNGQLIKQGKVDELSRYEDEMIISSDNLAELGELLKDSQMVKAIKIIENDIIITLQEGYAPVDINKFAGKNGHDLTKMEIKKRTLEDQFLEAIK